MTIPEHIALWGSIASIIGLVIAFIGIVKNRNRITELERLLTVDVDANSQSRACATAEAKGGTQTADQSIGSITQSVGSSAYHGLHRTTCPHLPSGEKEVDASIAPATGLVMHVICSRLRKDYSCNAEGNRGGDCTVIHPCAIRIHRNTLRARRET